MSKELDDLQRVPIKALSTFKGRCKHLYKIQAKSGKTVPFEFFEAQDYFNDIVNEEFERTKREFGHAQCRIIALKPRQVGWTTYSNIKSLDMQIQHQGSNGVIAAHDKDTTELIYRIYDRAYDELPEYIVPTLDGKDMSKRQFYKYSLSDQQLKQLDFNLSSEEFSQTHKVKIQPDTKSHTGKQIEFTDTDSLTVIFTAGKGDDGGKAGTIRRIHFCMSEDSKVILSNGHAKPIKDVEIGEQVLTSDGKVAPVKDKFETGKKETISLRTWLSDEDIKVSKDHKVLTDSGWTKAKNLIEDDYVQLPDLKLTDEITEYTYDLDSREDVRWSTTTGVKKHTFDLDYDFGYLIGYYLAEGHVKYNKKKDIYTQLEFAHHTDEDYVDLVKEKFGHLATSIQSKKRENSKTHKTLFYGSFLPNMLNDVCGRTDGKHIPDWFFKTNKEFVEGVIIGYLCGDGSKTQYTWKREYGGHEKWSPPNSVEKIYNYLQEYKKIKENHKTVKELDKEYNISETAGNRYRKLFGGKTLQEIKNNWFDKKLTNKTPEEVYNYLTERNNIERYPTKGLNEKYGVTASATCVWRKKYMGKSVDYIKNNYGGRKANSKDEYNYEYIGATSICERITRQLRRLIIALDVGVPSVRYEEERYRYEKKTKPIYQLLCNGQVAKYFSNKIDGCESSGTLQKSSNRYKKIDGKWFVKLKNIEKSKVVQTYDIEVDHHTHDFETPIGIVSNSEAASYSDYKDLITSINPSVPDFEDNIFFILESTANGTTGDGEGFYKAWEKATQEWERYQKGEIQTFSGFRPVFIPWYMLEEYELPLAGGKFEDIENVDFGSPEAKQNFLDREEKMLEEGIYNPLTKQHQKVTPEKINWYRWVIKKKCEFDYKKAQRYYPTTPDEAFVASSNCFFDSMKLNEVKNKRLNDGEPESELGDLLWSKEDGELEFRPSNLGKLTVWEKPEPDWDNRYVIGADIGRGYEDGDYSVAYVKDRLKQKIVACFHGKVDQDIFAEHLIELGIYYNEALLVPESNLDTVVNIIKPDGSTPYIGEIYYNESGNSVKWGFWTESSSRQILIDTYKAWLRDNEEGYEVLPDLDTIDEHLSFVRRETRSGVKYEADEGSHDDRVISLALTQIGDQWWDAQPEKYEPNKIQQLISESPNQRRSNYLRNSDLGKTKRGR